LADDPAKPRAKPSCKGNDVAPYIWVKPGGSNLPYATVCLRVKLAMHDKALKHWLRWARKQRGRDLIPPIDVDSPLVAEVCKHNWIYFGPIPPARITVQKHVPRGKPYVEVPRIRKARLAGANVQIDRETLAAYMTGSFKKKSRR
jgi:hypothetical protein